MSGSTSPSETAAIVAAASALFAATFPPAMRLARADHLTPRWVRDLPVTAAFLLLLLTPIEVTR